VTKGKHKRKKQRAQQQAQPSAANAPVVEQEEMAENKTEPSTQRTANPQNDPNPSRWKRFAEWVKRESSFTDWCVAAFTCVLAFAAIYQFIIMGGQLDVMRKDQRAWIAIAQKSGTTIAVNTAPFTSISISNTGKTPATGMVGNFYVEVVPKGESPHFEAQIMHTTMISNVVLPNAPQEVTVVRRMGVKPDEAADNPITENEKASLNDGKAWIAVHGIVWYDDIFHRDRHWIKFCFWSDLKPGGVYSSRGCAIYNSVDDK
jgi:hypothetical protein